MTTLKLAKLNHGAIILAAAMLAAPAAMAATVTYWAPSAGDVKRKVAHEDNADIIEWTYAGGVKFRVAAKEAGAKDTVTTVERKNLLGISRKDEERGQLLRDAMAKNDIAGLNNAAKSEKSPIDREEAAWEAAWRSASAKPAAGIKAYGDYLKDWGKGNWAADARIALARLNGDGPGAAEALRLLAEAADLGEVARAQAGTLSAKIMLKQGRAKEAAEQCEAAATAAAAIRHSEYQLDALAWKGTALKEAKDLAGAKDVFAAAMKVRILPEYDPAVQRNAKGLAQKGLAEISGNTQEGYDAWLSAAYWLGYGAKEADCIIGALTVAEALAATDKEKWDGRIKTLRATASKNFPAALQTYDQNKAGAKGK